MKAIRIITGMLVIFVTLPIWFFLIYTLLQAAHVDRLVWFLFWIYVPVTIFANVVDKIVDKVAKNAN